MKSQNKIKLKPDDTLFDFVIPPSVYVHKKYKKPYITEFSKNGTKLVCFGVEHSQNPENRQFKKIEKFVDRLLIKGFPRDTIFIGEGVIPEVLDLKSELIERCRETGLLAYLAYKNGVKLISCDPSQEQITRFILQKKEFDNYDLALWMFINGLNYLLGLSNPISKDGINNMFIAILKSYRGLNIEISDANQRLDKFLLVFKKRLHEITGKDILPATGKELVEVKLDKKIIHDLQNPFSRKTIINRIGGAFNDTRDRFMAVNILNAVMTHKQTFVVLGANHVVAEEPVFKRFFR